MLMISMDRFGTRPPTSGTGNLCGVGPLIYVPLQCVSGLGDHEKCMIYEPDIAHNGSAHEERENIQVGSNVGQHEAGNSLSRTPTRRHHRQRVTFHTTWLVLPEGGISVNDGMASLQ